MTEAEELAAAFAEVWSLLHDDQTLTLGTAFEGTRYLAHEEPNLHSVLGYGWGPTATGRTQRPRRPPQAGQGSLR